MLTLGWQVAKWVHNGDLIQPNGPRSGKPFRLTFDQLRFLLWWYAVDESGQWLYTHGVRRLAKGSGKSPFAAILALIEFCGPCRLERFDDRLEGGCKAKPADLPLVQIAATAESQTANTMRMVRAFAPKGSRFAKAHDLDVGKTRYYKLPEGTLEVITSSSTAAEGAESSFVVADETEHWKPANGGPDLMSTLADNLAKSGARLLETSNAWVPGIDSVAESTWDAYVAQEEGHAVESSILYDARIAPPDTNLHDPESFQEALWWVYGDCEWRFGEDGKPDVRPIIKRARTLTSQPDEIKRKYLNWPTTPDAALCSVEEWTRLAQHREVDPTEPVVLFFDGSKSRDATAVVAACVSDGYIFVPHVWGRPTVWEPNPAHNADDVVPVAEVDAALDVVFASHNVVGFFGDVQEWESFVSIEWPRRFAKKLKVKAVPTGRQPEPIAWDMRSRQFDFAKAVELTIDEILEGSFHHDGNPTLARHVANTERNLTRYGLLVRKRESSRKIDAAVCMIGARMVRRLAIAAGIGGTRKPAKVVVLS